MKALTGITDYFKGVRSEAKKIVWPTFPTLVQHFISVIVGLALFTAFVAGVDYVFIQGLALLIKN
jgi:preprotein translocase SecE subunit